MHGNIARAAEPLALRLDAGLSAPVALDGLRRILGALEAEHHELVRDVARRSPAAWNRLFPGTFEEAPLLDEVALSPSERRLHRESEQMFHVLNLAAEILCETLRATGRRLVIERAGACNLVSLRAVMRAQEWARLHGEPLPVVLEGWSARSLFSSERFEARRQRFQVSLRERLRIPGVLDGPADVVSTFSTVASTEPEARYLQVAIDEGASLEVRLAAAVRAIRCCFFSTNYEGAMLAVAQGLSLLDRSSGQVSAEAVRTAWDELGQEQITAAIEIDREDLGTASELRALFHRAEGVVLSYCGENDAALEAFGRGIECEIGPLQRSHLYMFRALSRIKRLGQNEEAREEAYAGLQALSAVEGDKRRLHEAWLRNVVALTWFRAGKLESALGEILQATRCVADQHNPSATHLRINLITNMSSIQEAAGKHKEAISTWRTFERMKSAWDTNFSKHHRYRLGGLMRLGGQVEEALEHYDEAYRSAAALKDPFHQQVIASDLGQLHLKQGRADVARSWFEKATGHARAIGDPFHVGEGLAGEWLCGEEKSGSALQALKALEADSTWPRLSARLQGALEKKDRTEVQKAMTPPHSKLNRPFDLVNLY